jgi:hypothetical protein
VAGLGGAGIGGGGGARRLRYFLLCGLAGLLEVLGGVVARHLLHVLGGGVAGGVRAIDRTVARAHGVLGSVG